MNDTRRRNSPKISTSESSFRRYLNMANQAFFAQPTKAGVEDFQKNRPTTTSHPGSSGFTKNYMYNQSHFKNQSGPLYTAHPTSNSADNVSVLVDQLGNMGMANHPHHVHSKQNPQVTSTGSEYNGVAVTMAPPFMYNGQVLYSSHVPQASGVGQATLAPSPHLYGPFGPQYASVSHNFQPYQHQLLESPRNPSWTSSRIPSSEMPSLIAPRRDSSSSNEHETPGTPFTHWTNHSDMHSGGIAVVDRSPHSFYSWGTPSPTQMNVGKQLSPSAISPRLQALVREEPAVPPAVPAPYSPAKPLDRCLENPNGVTNVYIRGLHPDTTDEKLHTLATRFGDIVSSKSIIDHETKQCKGYGFVKYHNYADAEDCIRGFHHMGYETSFARESFYSQLKKLADEENTNLYVSNLPKDINEHELSAIFLPHKVCSSRILRDGGGIGRGVGFARFESREVCEKIIEKFNNTPVVKDAGEEHYIQIRFADTQEQKALKQATTAARQYRTAEYESQTQGRVKFMNSVAHPSPQNSQATAEGDFATYMGYPNGTLNPQAYGRFPVHGRLNNLMSQLGTKRDSSETTTIGGVRGDKCAEARVGSEQDIEHQQNGHAEHAQNSSSRHDHVT